MNKVYVVFISIIMGLLLVVGGLSIYAIKKNKIASNTINELNSLNSTLQSDLKRLNGQLGELVGQVTSLEDGNKQLEGTIGQLRDANSRLTASYNSLAGQLSAARTTIAELTKRLNEITGRLSTVREIVSSISSGSGKAEDLIIEIIAGFNKLKEAVIGQGNGVQPVDQQNQGGSQ